MIEKEVFTFLNKLAKNNDRDWFAKNKSTYEKAHQNVKDVFGEIRDRLEATDNIERLKVHRIYRDVRFSKDKSPYKTAFSASLVRATEELRGGYFLKLEPGKSFVGGGFYAPNKEDLLRVRQEIQMDDTELRDIINHREFKKVFGTLQGQSLKTAPRGFDPDHKSIDLLRMKNYYAMQELTDEIVLGPDFVDVVIHAFETIRPYFNFMSEVLTTNLNGESILD